MAEKITASEMLDDDELDNVAGGTLDEVIQDAKNLRSMGKFNFDKTFENNKMADALKQLGKELDVKLDIRYNNNLNGERNRYFIGKREYTHEQFWTVINNLYNYK